MSFTFRPAVREGAGVLVGLAGASGSGKTYSALRLATGLSGGKPFAVIDTENGRALHYADLFKFEHAHLRPPFRPEAYAKMTKAADAAGYPVIVVDSFSHEHAGEGGLLDWHEEELERMAGDDWQKRERVKFSAWIKPKMAHKAMVQQLLQARAHLILCFRAEEKIEIVKDAAGKVQVRPKQTLTGLDGWVPICEKSLPYELTASFLLTPDAPGLPKPIKLQEQHRAFFPLDGPISEESGEALAGWARGGAKTGPAPDPDTLKTGGDSPRSDEGDAGGAGTTAKTGPAPVGAGSAPPESNLSTQTAASGASTDEWAAESDVTEALVLASRLGNAMHDKAVDAIAKHRANHDGRVQADWLSRQAARFTAALEAWAPVPEAEDEAGIGDVAK
jgi:hypothetical protein